MNPTHYQLEPRPKNFTIVPYQSTHNTGGTIMGADPSTSVVNRYLQAWDADNLFVEGASVFPQQHGYNPTGTVGALAYWSAHAIVTQYLKSPGPLVVNGPDSMQTTATAALGAAWLAAVAVLTVPASVQAADAAHGKQVFAACAACHSDKPDAIGPSLRGVFGRKSGTLADFRHSNAMRRAGLVWNEDNLRAYIKDPQGKVPGNRMPFGGLQSDKDVDDVVAYLRTYR